jgi:hypothetical protein
MACDLSLGRKEPCKDVVGGIKAVYFADFGDFSTIAYVTGTDVIDTLGSGLTVLQYMMLKEILHLSKISPHQEKTVQRFLNKH